MVNTLNTICQHNSFICTYIASAYVSGHFSYIRTLTHHGSIKSIANWLCEERVSEHSLHQHSTFTKHACARVVVTLGACRVVTVAHIIAQRRPSDCWCCCCCCCRRFTVRPLEPSRVYTILNVCADVFTLPKTNKAFAQNRQSHLLLTSGNFDSQ